MVSLIFFIICGALVLVVVIAMGYHRKKVQKAKRPKSPASVDALKDAPGRER